ncbi:MAG: hypothetical protein MJ106_00695 [Lentisphaeria bacterium]|nr:hypothetical protein [Lentisphaeria bacterium]
MMLKKNDNANVEAPAPKFNAPKKSSSSLGDKAVIGCTVVLIAALVLQLMSLKALFLF